MFAEAGHGAVDARELAAWQYYYEVAHVARGAVLLVDGVEAVQKVSALFPEQKFMFVDGDCVEESNLNRQLIATRENLGIPKAEVARARALSINPDADITALNLFYDESTADQIDLSRYDFVADCIDSVPSKLLLIERAKSAGCRVVCAMGAGNKLDPTAFEIADIEKTTVCPLARTVRQQLRKRGVRGVKAVFSHELPYRIAPGAPGSISFVPGAAGLALAGEIIREIAEVESK